jgi:hypothetical protein
MRSTGLSIHGGLEHHARLAPAVAAQPLVVEAEDVLSLEQDLAAADVGGRLVQPATEKATVDLPQPDSPARPNTSPA